MPGQHDSVLKPCRHDALAQRMCIRLICATFPAPTNQCQLRRIWEALEGLKNGFDAFGVCQQAKVGKQRLARLYAKFMPPHVSVVLIGWRNHYICSNRDEGRLLRPLFTLHLMEISSIRENSRIGLLQNTLGVPGAQRTSLRE